MNESSWQHRRAAYIEIAGRVDYCYFDELADLSYFDLVHDLIDFAVGHCGELPETAFVILCDDDRGLWQKMSITEAMQRSRYCHFH